ncbi:hypothetical protein D3C87_1224820 [compost metagenome]
MLERGADALVQHRDGPDQAGVARAALGGAGALGLVDPARQDAAHFRHVALLVGSGADHQAVHFLVVGVAFEQIGDLAPQENLRGGAAAHVRVGVFVQVEQAQPGAVAREIQQVDRRRTGIGGFIDQRKDQLGRERRQLTHRQADRCAGLVLGHRHHADGAFAGRAQARQRIDVHDAVDLTQPVGPARDQGLQRRLHGFRMAEIAQRIGQLRIQARELRQFIPKDREQLGALGAGEARGELHGALPVAQLQLLQVLGELLMGIVPERHNVVGGDARHHRPVAQALEAGQHLLDALFVQVIGDLLMVEVVEVRVHQDLGDFDFVEDLQRNRVSGGRGAGAVGEPRHQASGFLAAAGGIHVHQEVDQLGIEAGFELAVLSGGQRRDQVRLASLGQAEEAEPHRGRAGAAKDARGIARAVQAQGDVVGFAVEPLGVGACRADPLDAAGGAVMDGGPAVGQLCLLRRKIAHLRFTLPLSSQYLVSLRPASSMVFSSSSRSARALKVTPMQLVSTFSMPSLSLSSPCFSALLSASTCNLTRRYGASPGGTLARANFWRADSFRRKLYSGVAAQRSARNWRNPSRVSPRTANDTVASSSPAPVVGRRMRPSADWMSR